MGGEGDRAGVNLVHEAPILVEAIGAQKDRVDPTGGPGPLGIAEEAGVHPHGPQCRYGSSSLPARKALQYKYGRESVAPGGAPKRSLDGVAPAEREDPSVPRKSVRGPSRSSGRFPGEATPFSSQNFAEPADGPRGVPCVRRLLELIAPALERAHRGLGEGDVSCGLTQGRPRVRVPPQTAQGRAHGIEERPGQGVGPVGPIPPERRPTSAPSATVHRPGEPRGGGHLSPRWSPGPSVMPIRPPLRSKSPAVFPRALKGRVEWNRFTSHVLEGNPWGDPVERDVPVYLPPSGDTEGKPLLVLLSGYTGAGWMHFQRPRYLSDSHISRFDRLVRSGLAPEAVVIAPDALTSLGGSQYLNSSATGRYDDYVTRELVPWARERYTTGPVGILGTSSGGFGAISLALRHPDVFRAAASDSGDMYFEYGYLPEFALAWRAIRRAGGPEALLKKLFSGPVDGFGPSNPLARGLELMAYASCYSPDDAHPGSFDLPFDMETGALRPEVWARWLSFDPVRMIQTPRYRRALRQLRYVYVDGGREDEWNLEVCARIFASVARAQGVTVDFEEFSGGHSDVGPRYEAMFPRLLRALGSPAVRPRSAPRRGRPTPPRSRPRTSPGRRSTS